MFTFFDFLYYSVYIVYRNGKDSSPGAAAAAAIAGFQRFNLLSAVMLFNVVMNQEIIYLSKVPALITFGVLAVLNYIRYIRSSKFSIETIKVRWQMKTKNSQEDSRLFQGGYVIVSVLLFFMLIFRFASKKMW